MYLEFEMLPLASMLISPELDIVPPESLMIAESEIVPLLRIASAAPGSIKMYSLELRVTVPLSEQVLLPSQDPPMLSQTLPTAGFVIFRTYSVSCTTVTVVLPLLARLFESPRYEAVR
jgi:hypothetical protein